MKKKNNKGSISGYDILVLSPVATYPLNQGNRHRVFSVCKSFKDLGARVHFAYYPFEVSQVSTSHIKEMSKQWDSFYYIPRTIPVQPPPQHKPTSHLVDEWWDGRAIEPFLNYIFKQRFYDIFVVNYVFMSKAFEFAPSGTYKILDTHDKFSKRFHLYVNMNLPPGFFYTSVSEEKKGLNRADLILAIKDEEEEFFRKISDKKVITLPYIQEKLDLKYSKNIVRGDVLKAGFVGSLNGVNIGNSISFVSQALPVFKERQPKLKIIFGGSMCYAIKDRIPQEGEDYIELYGSFETVEDFYTKVDLIVLPIEISTGLKIRAVEAFAAGLPVVSHEHAVEGIPVTHRFHRCKSMKEIAEVLVEISNNPEILTELKKASIETYNRLTEKYQRALSQTVDEIISFKNSKGVVVIEVDGNKFIKSNQFYYVKVINLVNHYLDMGKFVYLYFKSIKKEGYFFYEREYGKLGMFVKAIIPPDVTKEMKMENIEQDFPIPCVVLNIDDFKKCFENLEYVNLD